MQPTVPGRVLLGDRWSLAEALVSMARDRTKDGSSVLKTNRTLEPHRGVRKDAAGQRLPLTGPHLAVADLVPLLPPTAYRAVTVGDTTSWTFPRAGRLPGLGTARLVVRFDQADLTGPSAVWVPHRVDGHAQRIIARSLQRWPIATLDQDRQTSLGWDAYRMRNAEAMGKHGCLVCVASAFLPRDGLPPSRRPGSLPLKTMGAACRQQAQALLQALILYAHEPLQRGQQAAELFAALFAQQQPVLVK